MNRPFFARKRFGSNAVFRAKAFAVFASAVLSLADVSAFSPFFFPFDAPRSRLFAADGSCLWGAANEKTTYSPPYYSSMAPNIPVLTRPEKTSDASGTSNSSGTSAPPDGIATVGPEFEAKLGESGTLVGANGKAYSYSYIRGVQPFRETTSTWVQETPPGGLFPIWVEKKTSRIVWKPVLIKLLRPLNEASGPSPCVPAAKVLDDSGSTNPSVVSPVNPPSGPDSEPEPPISFATPDSAPIPFVSNADSKYSVR